jgi:hypothetical protein
MNLIDKCKATLKKLGEKEWRLDGHCILAPNTDPGTKDEYADIIVADCSDDPITESGARANALVLLTMRQTFPHLVETVMALGDAIKARHAGEEVDWEKLEELYGRFEPAVIQIDVPRSRKAGM